MSKHGRKRITDISQIECPNPLCPDFQKRGSPMIVSNGRYRMKEGMGQRFKCKSCGQSFCKRTGTLFGGFYSPEEKIISAIKLLSKGLSIRKASQVAGVKADTLTRWLNHLKSESEKVDEVLIQEHGVSSEELAVLWNFVKQGKLRQRGIDWRRRSGWRQGWDTE